MKREKRQLYAIVRMESNVQSCNEPKNSFTVKEILTDEREAELEVQRLNALAQQNETGATYWCQITRTRDAKLQERK